MGVSHHYPPTNDITSITCDIPLKLFFFTHCILLVRLHSYTFYIYLLKSWFFYLLPPLTFNPLLHLVSTRLLPGKLLYQRPFIYYEIAVTLSRTFISFLLNLHSTKVTLAFLCLLDFIYSLTSSFSIAFNSGTFHIIHHFLTTSTHDFFYTFSRLTLYGLSYYIHKLKNFSHIDRFLYQ